VQKTLRLCGFLVVYLVLFPFSFNTFYHKWPNRVKRKNKNFEKNNNEQITKNKGSQKFASRIFVIIDCRALRDAIFVICSLLIVH